MKYVILSVFALTLFSANAQRDPGLTKNALTGTWSLVRANATNDTLYLRKIPRATKLDGSEFSFSPDGTITKAVKPTHPPRGNDTSLLNNSGNWTIDRKGTTLTVSILILNGKKEFEIIELTRNTLTLADRYPTPK